MRVTNDQHELQNKFKCYWSSPSFRLKPIVSSKLPCHRQRLSPTMDPLFDKRFRFPPPEKINQFPEDPHAQKGNRKWEWYEPPANSLPTNFCIDTSLHGLKYLGQPKRHLFERIFWLTAFVAAVITALVLISGLLAEFRDVPIITIFNPTEIEMDEIPFPGVTVCNGNNIRKSKVMEAKRFGEPRKVHVDDLFSKKAMEAFENPNLSEEEKLQTYARLMDIHHICESGTSFTNRFSPFPSPYFEIQNTSLYTDLNRMKKDFSKYMNPVKTLSEGAQPCVEMIMFCIWLDEDQDCGKLFHEVETDTGYCCAFNTIPISLLMKHGDDPRDDPNRVEEWRIDDITTDNLLFTAENLNSRRHPKRQKYPGRPAGLSILLDPDLDDYYCTNTDSEGYLVSLNVPLDFPRLRDNGIAVRTNSEVFISVKPTLTLSDKSVHSFDLVHRQCYFGKEYVLPHYSKYTTSNCMDECIANKTMETCKCVRYYMPGGHNLENLCNPEQYPCTENIRKDIVTQGLAESCRYCLPPCTELHYESETTSMPIREDYIDSLFKHHNRTRPRHPSILHVYMNVDSIFPRLRKELTSKTELISNAGGLLGLCMGFSVLSLLEILYYCTIRLACCIYRRRTFGEEDLPGEDDTVSQVLVQDATALDLKLKKGTKRRKRSWFPSVLSWSPSARSREPSLPPSYNEHFEADFRRTCFGLALIEEMQGAQRNKKDVPKTMGYYNWIN